MNRLLHRIEKLLWFLGGRLFRVAGWLAARRRSKEPPEVKPFSYGASFSERLLRNAERDAELLAWLSGETEQKRVIH
jgi:hypothetical protein